MLHSSPLRLLAGRRRGALFGPTAPALSPFQSNLTSLTNQVNRNENLRKYGSAGASAGVPRIPRLAVRPISVLHETPHVTVVGRNFSNGFSSNQYLLVNKQNKECIFIDACDDWPDDWAAFISSSGLTPTHVFLTHCHVDNIINLNALMSIVESHLGARLGLMWCQAETPWLEAFPKACHRYGRMEESRITLPMFQNTLYSYNTYALRLKQEQDSLDSEYRRERQQRARQRRLDRRAASGGRRTGREEEDNDDDDDFFLDGDIGAVGSLSSAAVPKPPQLVRQQDILLSCATNRATSFYEFGPHNVLHYVFTPGHSPGHMMLSLPRERLLFTGDVLFYNKIGRVDLPWAAGDRLAESLMAMEGFSDTTVLLPGHGRLTTLGRERRENPALRSLYERRELGKQEVSVGFNDGYL